ncbi:putative diguanylate cyclase YegE [Shewanella sp. P1-14-1]|uniref:GGDEF domain-containing protein n=1 Tax=Shewanella sp. P1-14-1 TaxID=1723761 RepID=UPI0006D65DC6|nr:GGDEF domain-containing protein [Shewanella sp. P1-14-1]KPZ72536.1 putative diguanylate cyclase YegE [Shewanella sp. P1-14-1]
MMNMLTRFSLKQKAIAATIVLVLVLLSITLVSLVSFSSTQERLTKVTSQYQPKMLSAMQLTSHFYHSLSVLGNYLIEKDDYNMNLYREKVNDINSTLTELVNLTNLNPELDDSEQLLRIRQLVDKIITHNISMLELAQNNNKNMPAIGIASSKLEPIAINMNQIVNDLLLATAINEQQSILPLIEDLRYNWIMLVSEVRNYLAFRQLPTIDEIALFKTGVNQSFEALEIRRYEMDDDQLDLLDEFEANTAAYQAALVQAINIHAGNNWRADRQLMKQNITPTLKELTKELEVLVTKQQRRIHESNLALSKQISEAENTIRFSIQVALAIALLVIFLSFKNKRLLSDILIHKESERKLFHKAHHDTLTKLANRAFFDDRLFKMFLDQETRSKRRSKRENNLEINSYFFGLLYIDLDGFKAVNDNVGHDAGDFILIEVAKRMKNVVRNSDIVCRLGGDEFAVLLNDINHINSIEKISENLCKTISQPYHYKEQVLNVSASIGFSYSRHPQLPLHKKVKFRMEAIIKQADTAMYHAKENGKNQYAQFK